jgi:hypothetical protein
MLFYLIGQKHENFKGSPFLFWAFHQQPIMLQSGGQTSCLTGPQMA